MGSIFNLSLAASIAEIVSAYPVRFSSHPPPFAPGPSPLLRHPLFLPYHVGRVHTTHQISAPSSDLASLCPASCNPT